MFKRISAVIACILTAVWLSRQPDWEPLAAFVALFLAYVGIEVSDYRRQQKKKPVDSSQSPKPPPQPIVIHSAFWHTDASHRKDVADIIKSLIEVGTRRIPADIRLFGDPHHGRVKTLTVDYSIGGQKKTKTVNEHEVFDT
jgi:hypothetical protein